MEDKHKHTRTGEYNTNKPVVIKTSWWRSLTNQKLNWKYSLGLNWEGTEGPFREHENNLYTNLCNGYMSIHMSKAIEIYI